MKLSVNLGENSYPIYIENGILSHAGDYISQVFSGRKIMLISDDRVFPLYGEKVKASLNDYECHSLVLPHGEPSCPTGSLRRVFSLYRKFMKLY